MRSRMGLTVPLLFCLLELLELRAAPFGRMGFSVGLWAGGGSGGGFGDFKDGSREKRSRGGGPRLYAAYATDEKGADAIMAAMSGPARRARGGTRAKATTMLLEHRDAEKLSKVEGIGAVEQVTSEMKLSPSAMKFSASGREAAWDTARPRTTSAQRHQYAPQSLPVPPLAQSSSRTLKSTTTSSSPTSHGSMQRIDVLVAEGESDANALAVEWAEGLESICREGQRGGGSGAGGSGGGGGGGGGGGSSVAARSMGGGTAVIVEVPADCVAEAVEWLADQQLSTWVEVPGKYVTHNRHANVILQGGISWSTTASLQDPIWAQGITGDGEILGVSDTGLDYDSIFFRDPLMGSPPLCVSDRQTGSVIGAECQPLAQEHRKIVRYRYFRTNSGDLASTVGDGAVGSTSDGHGTHICGSMAGSAAVPADPVLEAQAALSNGAAPDARIAFDDIADEGSDDLGGIPDDIGEGLIGPTYDAGARIYGMSWGSVSDNSYSMSAQNVDKFVHEHDDMLVLVAAGNDGEGSWGPVPHTVTSPATAKNILSVGSSWNSIMAAAAYGSLDPFDREDPDSQWNMASRIVPLPQSSDTRSYKGYFTSLRAVFGPVLNSNKPLNLVVAQPVEACGQSSYLEESVLTNKADCVGKAVIIDRGTCYFVDKVAAAKAAGAEYVVVVQYSAEGDPIDMSAPEGYGNASKPAADIPAVMVSYEDGEQLKQLASTGASMGFWDFEGHLSSFSGRGPVMGNGGSEMRMKPDVVCPGDSILSAMSDGNLSTPGIQASLVQMSGTSMSTPLCTGAAALVRQYLREGWHVAGTKDLSQGISSPSAALLKSFMIHSAKPIRRQSHPNGWTWMEPQTMTPENSYDYNGNYAPNRDYGYGLVDLPSVLSFDGARDIFIRDRREMTSPGNPHCYRVVMSGGEERLRATLVWTDPKGDLGRNTMLINDLDLIVYSHAYSPVIPYDEMYYGNGFEHVSSLHSERVRDSLNNAEQVTIQSQRATTAGSSFSIFVRPQYFWSDTGKQDYSLVVTGKFTVGECEADSYKLLCPNDCSGLGECFDNGECVCDVGYGGDDCSHFLPRLYRDVDVEFAVTSESWTYMRLTIITKGDTQIKYSGTQDPDFYLSTCVADSGHDNCKMLPEIGSSNLKWWDAQSGGVERTQVLDSFQPGDYVVGVLAFCCQTSSGKVTATGSGVAPDPNGPSPTPSPTPAPTPTPPYGTPPPPSPPSPYSQAPTPAPTPSYPFITKARLEFKPISGMSTIVGSVDFEFDFAGLDGSGANVYVPASSKFVITLPGFVYERATQYTWGSSNDFSITFDSRTSALTLTLNKPFVSTTSDYPFWITIPHESNLRLPAVGVEQDSKDIKIAYSVDGTSRWVEGNRLRVVSLSPLPPTVVRIRQGSDETVTAGLFGSVTFSPNMFAESSVQVTVQAERMASTKTTWGESGSDALVISMGALPKKAIEVKVTAYSPVGDSRRSRGVYGGDEDLVDVGGGRRGGANSDGKVLRLYMEMGGGWAELESSNHPSSMQVYGTANPGMFESSYLGSQWNVQGKFVAWWVPTQSAGGNPSSSLPISPPGSASPSAGTAEQDASSSSSSGSSALDHAQLIVYICVPVIAVCMVILGVLRRRQNLRRARMEDQSVEPAEVELSSQALSPMTGVPAPSGMPPPSRVGLLIRSIEDGNESGWLVSSSAPIIQPSAPTFPRDPPFLDSQPGVPSAPPAPPEVMSGSPPPPYPGLDVGMGHLFGSGRVGECVDVPAVIPAQRGIAVEARGVVEGRRMQVRKNIQSLVVEGLGPRVWVDRRRMQARKNIQSLVVEGLGPRVGVDRRRMQSALPGDHIPRPAVEQSPDGQFRM